VAFVEFGEHPKASYARSSRYSGCALCSGELSELRRCPRAFGEDVSDAQLRGRYMARALPNSRQQTE